MGFQPVPLKILIRLDPAFKPLNTIFFGRFSKFFSKKIWIFGIKKRFRISSRGRWLISTRKITKKMNLIIREFPTLRGLVMIIFYVAVIMNLEKSDFFKSNFRPEGVKIGQSRGNIKFLEASKDIKNEIKIWKISKNSKRLPPP
jgi:hypothetical protein